MSGRLFIGVGGHIVALDPGSGEEIWRTRLKTSAYATVSVAGDRLYGAAGGELFCLDPATGSVIWRNRLKGLGIGVVAFPGDASAVTAASADAQRRAAASA